MAGQDKTKVSSIREQLQGATGLLEGTMEGVTPEQAHWMPPGTANSIGANYAHVVIGQDGLINGRLKGGAPLFASTWSGRVGVSELPPGPDPKQPGFPDWAGWARRLKVDLPALRGYAKAVYSASDTYLESLSDDDLSQSIDMGALGLGKMPLGQVLTAGVLGNCLTHCGEISCLKGLQGGKGYPR